MKTTILLFGLIFCLPVIGQKSTKLTGDEIKLHTTTKSDQRLDSIVYKSDEGLDMYKIIYAYDDKGNNTEIVDYGWYDNKWEGVIKNEYVYDNNSKQTGSALYSWENNQWVGFIKRDSIYNVHGDVTETTIYEWNKKNAWIICGKDKYTYDSKNKLTQHIRVGWDDDIKTWKNGWKMEHQYDSNGNRTQYMHAIWNDTINTWRKVRKVNFQFDSKGNNTEEISYKWDEDKSNWQEDTKYEYTYGNNGNETKRILYGWSEKINNWLAWSADEWTYNNKNNLTEYIYLNWDPDLNIWVPHRKEEYIYGNEYLIKKNEYDFYNNTDGSIVKKYEYDYDENGNRTEEVCYVPGTDNNWIGEFKDEYIFDNHGNQTHLFSYKWDHSLNDWRKRDIITYYYSSGNNTGIEPLTNDEAIRIYPNPTTGKVFIENSSDQIPWVRVLNMQGVPLQQVHSNEADLSGYANGTYLIRVNDTTYKVIKR